MVDFQSTLSCPVLMVDMMTHIPSLSKYAETAVTDVYEVRQVERLTSGTVLLVESPLSTGGNASQYVDCLLTLGMYHSSSFSHEKSMGLRDTF